MTPDPLPRFAAGHKQAAAMLNAAGHPCTADHLLRAKREGVAAFRSSRVYFEQSLFDWLEVNPYEAPLPDANEDGELEDKETLERRRLREQYLTAKQRRLVADGKFIAKSEVMERDTIAIAQFRAALSGLRADAPQWSGLPPHEILKRVTEKTNAALRTLELAFRKLAK